MPNRTSQPVRLAAEHIPDLWRAIEAAPHEDDHWHALADEMEQQSKPGMASVLRQLASGDYLHQAPNDEGLTSYRRFREHDNPGGFRWDGFHGVSGLQTVAGVPVIFHPHTQEIWLGPTWQRASGLFAANTETANRLWAEVDEPHRMSRRESAAGRRLPVRLAAEHIPDLYRALEAKPSDRDTWHALADEMEQQGRPHMSQALRIIADRGKNYHYQLRAAGNSTQPAGGHTGRLGGWDAVIEGHVSGLPIRLYRHKSTLHSSEGGPWTVEIAHSESPFRTPGVVWGLTPEHGIGLFHEMEGVVIPPGMREPTWKDVAAARPTPPPEPTRMSARAQIRRAVRLAADPESPDWDDPLFTHPPVETHGPDRLDDLWRGLVQAHRSGSFGHLVNLLGSHRYAHEAAAGQPSQGLRDLARVAHVTHGIRGTVDPEVAYPILAEHGVSPPPAEAPQARPASTPARTGGVDRTNPLLDEAFAQAESPRPASRPADPDLFGGYEPGSQDRPEPPFAWPARAPRRKKGQPPPLPPPVALPARPTETTYRPGMTPPPVALPARPTETTYRPGMTPPGRTLSRSRPFSEGPAFAEPYHEFNDQEVRRHGDTWLPVARDLGPEGPYDVRQHGDMWLPVARRLSARSRLRRAVRLSRGRPVRLADEEPAASAGGGPDLSQFDTYGLVRGRSAYGRVKPAKVYRYRVMHKEDYLAQRADKNYPAHMNYLRERLAQHPGDHVYVLDGMPVEEARGAGATAALRKKWADKLGIPDQTYADYIMPIPDFLHKVLAGEDPWETEYRPKDMLPEDYHLSREEGPVRLMASPYRGGNSWFAFDTYLGRKQSRPAGNNRRLERLQNGDIGVRLHNTLVVIAHGPNSPFAGHYTLSSGGWRTRTTRDTINQFSPARVSFAQRHGSDWFYDGVRVDGSGDPVWHYDPSDLDWLHSYGGHGELTRRLDSMANRARSQFDPRRAAMIEAILNSRHHPAIRGQMDPNSDEAVLMSSVLTDPMNDLNIYQLADHYRSQGRHEEAENVLGGITHAPETDYRPTSVMPEDFYGMSRGRPVALLARTREGLLMQRAPTLDLTRVRL